MANFALQNSKSHMPHIPSGCLAALLFTISLHTQAQNSEMQRKVDAYFSTYKVDGYKPNGNMHTDSIRINEEGHTVNIYANEPFSSQPFTPSSVRRIYTELQRLIPAPHNTYHLSIFNTRGRLIEDLVPNILREGEADATRLWGKTNYEGHPWVKNTSLPYNVSRGLQGRHLFIWPSHGRYYKAGGWQWQRPYLFCTTEDLFTQSFVYPYLFPMLEKAGAIVYSPRERDIQTHEALVDNDSPSRQGNYLETNTEDFTWSSSADGAGFKMPDGLLNDSTHPFTLGTWRSIPATTRRNHLASATWSPRIPKSGRYSVYVSYASRPNSVPDAHYTIFHKGGRTNVQVNQQMGGNTWVYVGTYEFDEGQRSNARVMLTNQSAYRGIVTADGVRFGGGVGQVEREMAGTSGLPRFLEAARYQAQWCGIPDTLYNTTNGENDYADDLRVRGNLLNYLGGGSPYIPSVEGQRVPFELSLALHSDAGIRHDRSIYGSLSICTTQDAEEKTIYPSGLSRQASQDFSAMLLNNLTNDLSNEFKIDWTRREQWDRNYAETRMPNVPSAILEMLSHQNFEDMKYGHDPHFKFALARSVYKTVLRYVNFEHGIKRTVVQPLPVHAFSVTLSDDGTQATLEWQPTNDASEPTAKPTSYVVYTKVDNEDFDNGLNIGPSTNFSISISPDRQYSFRITAINAGGESFPSETLSVMHSSKEKARILIVNGFNRLSGPAWVENADSVGFDLHRDIGVPYLYTTSLSGAQQVFNPAFKGREGSVSLGYCGQELMGKRIAGNTFDYPVEHGRSIAAAGDYSFASVSREAFESTSLSLSGYAAIDYIAGLEADLPYNLRPYKTFPVSVQQRITEYLKNGKGALLVSGSYIGSDNTHSESDRRFTEDVLKFRYDGSARRDTSETASGLNLHFRLLRQPNADHYAVQAPDAILPASRQAFPAFAFGGGQGAGVAYKGRSYRVVSMSFPFECIAESKVRNLAMKALLDFLTDK